MTTLADDATRILAAIQYMVLATCGPDGSPHVSPVFFTRAGRELYWVSSPDAMHPRNLAAEPRVDAVVFDSTVRPGTGEAVYISGTAREVPDDEVESRAAVAFADPRGARRFGPEELSGSADLRLYVLEVETWEALVRGGHPTLGTGIDRRVTVELD